VTVWVSTQNPYMDKVTLFYVSNRTVNVRSIGRPCGGSFGSEVYVLADPVLRGALE